MADIRFETVKSHCTILNPYNNFTEELHEIEVRKDPLLGDTSVYNPYLKDKAKFFFGKNDADFIQRLIEESRNTCIFCGDRIEKGTARYADELIPGGKINAGEATLFANLFSVGQYHPVISLSKAHFLKLSEYTPELITNGLRAAQEFLHIVQRHDASASFATVNANYLLPAGASLVHPHMQMLVTPTAYSYHKRLIDACKAYYANHNASYCSDLIHTEKQTGLRYVASKGGWHWLTAFSPMGSNEIIGVHEKESDFGQLSDADLQNLAYGISRTLVFYEALGHLSFNYSLFSTKHSLPEIGFRCIIKIITRQNLYPNYRNDDYFLQKLLQSELIFNLPEELAKQLKGYF